MTFRLRNRSLATVLLPPLLAIAAQASGAQPNEPPTRIACTNANGYSWRIAIDYRRATVDANPATITAAEISWYDPGDGGHYTLDRKTGALSASVASSTGGFFRHARCTLEP
jgi:hypothetical protein